MTVWYPNEITIQDVRDVNGAAVRDFIKLPGRCRMRGMIVDIGDDDKRVLAFINATIEMLSRKGLVNPTGIIGPSVYTEVQEVIDEGTYGASFTPQKD